MTFYVSIYILSPITGSQKYSVLHRVILDCLLIKARRQPRYKIKYWVPLGSYKWAKDIDKDIKSQASFTEKALKCLPNRLTPLYSEIHYKEENYLKVKTELFIYPSPPYSKGLSMLRLSILVYCMF